MHLDLISKDVRCTSVGAMGLVGCVRLCFATTPQINITTIHETFHLPTNPLPWI